MSYSNSDPSSCCSASAELKLYQAFIFSIPIFFTFILLLLFYLFYLRRWRVDWASLRMRSSMHDDANHTSGVSELGLKKEVREMLPIIVFQESFSVSDTQFSSIKFLCMKRTMPNYKGISQDAYSNQSYCSKARENHMRG